MDQTQATFQRALAVAALARAFNGVISVAQGTEVAIQPVGVGVTLTLGEILDPINDLVERFSLLALLACVTLGLQLTLVEIFTTYYFAIALTVGAMTSIVLYARDPTARSTNIGLQIILSLIFIRFLPVLILLATQWVDSAFLESRQQSSMTQLQTTTEDIQAIQDAQAPQSESDGFFSESTEGIRNFLNSTQQTLDIRSQLQQVEERVERSVEEIINLIVVFLLQTLVIPIGAAFLAVWLFRAILLNIRRSWT